MKLDENTVRKLEQAFAIDCTVTEACLFANISRDTYYRWIKENKKLSDKFERLRARPILKARQEVVKGLVNYHNSMDYLKRKRKLEFSERLEHTGEDGKNIQIILAKEVQEKYDFNQSPENNSKG